MSYLSVNAYIKRKISFFIYFLNVLATMVATSSGNLFWNKIIKFLKLLEFYVTVRSSLLLSNLYLLHSVIFTAVLRMKIPCYDRIVLRKYEMFRRELSFLFSYSPQYKNLFNCSIYWQEDQSSHEGIGMLHVLCFATVKLPKRKQKFRQLYRRFWIRYLKKTKSFSPKFLWFFKSL